MFMYQTFLIFSFLLQIVLIYFLSRRTINNLFFPGTVVHEISHFLMASMLFLKVRSIEIFPKWEKNEIKLGSVQYEKKDFVRGILVGISPFFAGVLFFWSVSGLKLFPSQNVFLNLIFLYLIFTVSSMMFSSKRDLVDLIYIFPLLIFSYGFYYIFDLKLDFLTQNKVLLEEIFNFIKQVN